MPRRTKGAKAPQNEFEASDDEVSDMEDIKDDSDAGDPESDAMITSFARNLASGNKKTRRQALDALRQWLASRGTSVSDLEMRKLWRGIFFCPCHQPMYASTTLAGENTSV